MPELPEVETVCRVIRRVLEGRRIAEAEIVPDEIVLMGVPQTAFVEALEGRTVTGVGRKGKFWWVELDEKPALCGHLGMAGWIREIGVEGARLREHGAAPLEDATGRPKFLKMRLRSDEGREIVLTDGRRMAELWLADEPALHPRIAKLGPDVWSAELTAEDWQRVMGKRSAPIKALLLNQELTSGIGNWIADEVLYQAGIAPARAAKTITADEWERFVPALRLILQTSLDAEVISERFPKEWLFHYRWGGGRGADTIGGEAIVRETIGGRTTAWVPSRQK